MALYSSNHSGKTITNSKTITEENKYVLDARQNNPSLPGTLAYNLARKLDVVDGAAAHNGIFRGIDLTTIMTMDEIFANIANGSFKNEYIGDYFDITISTEYTPTETVRCVLAGFDTYLNNGDTPLTRHHAVIVPKNCFSEPHQMNPTNTTAGGYIGSSLYSTILGKYITAISNAIGSLHLITRRALLTNSISETGVSMASAGITGCSSGWDWYDTRMQLLSEIQVYGSNVCSSSFRDTGIDNLQLPLFVLNPAAKICKLGGIGDINANSRKWYWLKNIASASSFVYIGGDGHCDFHGTSYSGGIRPLFCIG